MCRGKPRYGITNFVDPEAAAVIEEKKLALLNVDGQLQGGFLEQGLLKQVRLVQAQRQMESAAVIQVGAQHISVRLVQCELNVVEELLQIKSYRREKHNAGL